MFITYSRYGIKLNFHWILFSIEKDPVCYVISLVNTPYIRKVLSVNWVVSVSYFLVLGIILSVSPMILRWVELNSKIFSYICKANLLNWFYIAFTKI